MFNVETYLGALGWSGPAPANLGTLRGLHKRHLMRVPYDSSLNAGRRRSLWDYVDIDPDEVFDDIIVGGRGGVCSELNGLFRILLDRLGFDVGVFSAGTRQLDNSFGPDLEHVFNYVRLDGETLLVDVGFVGPSYLEPLRMVDEVQYQYGNQFQLVEQDGYQVLRRQGRVGPWYGVYRFKPQPRSFAEWRVPSPEMTAFARLLEVAGTLIRGRSFETGQRILIGKRLLTVDDGHDEVRVLVDPVEYEKVLADILQQDA
jgi:amide synthase